MSNLAVSFFKRQPLRRDSESTVSSEDAVKNIKLSLTIKPKQTLNVFPSPDPSTPSPNILNNPTNINFYACKNIKIGEQINHVYYNCFQQVKYKNSVMDLKRYLISFITSDSRNPAFVLSNESVHLEKKLLYILSQKWCWGLLLLMIFILVLFTSVTVILLLSKLVTKNVTLGRSVWDADEPRGNLTKLNLPVSTIIVTHTADESKSCTSQVNKILLKLILEC